MCKVNFTEESNREGWLKKPSSFIIFFFKVLALIPLKIIILRKAHVIHNVDVFLVHSVGYVTATFVPNVRGHFCRTNGHQITFSTTTRISPIHNGYRALLASSHNIELCLEFCCKSSWCKHAYLHAGKCYGLSCYGGECGRVSSLVHSHTLAELQEKKLLRHQKNNHGKLEMLSVICV